MKLQIALTALVTVMVVACGTERPDPNDYIRKSNTDPVTQTDTTTKTGTKTADATKTPTNTMTNNTAATPTPTPTPTPAATPAATPPAKLALRTAPNAAELAAARTLYTGTCMMCHVAIGAVDGNVARNVKGKLKDIYPAAKAKAAHGGVAATFPVDTEDKVDDGVDTAKLNAAAMAEVLK